MLVMSSCGCIPAKTRCTTYCWRGDDCSQRTRRLLESHWLEGPVLVSLLQRSTECLCQAPRTKRRLHASNDCGRNQPVCGQRRSIGRQGFRQSADQTEDYPSLIVCFGRRDKCFTRSPENGHTSGILRVTCGRRLRCCRYQPRGITRLSWRKCWAHA